MADAAAGEPNEVSAADIIAHAEAEGGEGNAAVASDAAGSEEALTSQGSAEVEGHTADELSELEAFFADSDGETAEAKQTDDDAGERGGSRVEKRIRSLSARNREQRAQMAQMQQQMQQMQQMHMQQMQQQQQQMLEQMRHLAPQQQGQQDPVDEFKREVLSEAQKQLGGAYGPEIQRMRQELESFKQQQEEQQNIAQRRANAQQLNMAVDAAVDEVILPSVGGTMDKAQRDTLARMVLMVGHSERLPPKEAARRVRQTLNGYARGSIRHGYKAKGEKLRESQKAPEPTPSGVSGATGESFPDWSLLRKNGYKSYPQWEMAGRPSLS